MVAFPPSLISLGSRSFLYLVILKCPVNILVSILIKKIYMYTSSLALGVSPETPWWPLSPGDREQRRSGGGLVTAPSPQGVVSLGGRASPFLRQSVCSVQSEAAVGFIAPGFGFSAACGRDSSPTWARGTLRRAPRGVSGGVPGLHPPPRATSTHLPSGDNQKCPQTSPHVSWEHRTTLGKHHGFCETSFIHFHL